MVDLNTIRPLSVYAAGTQAFEVCAPMALSATQVRNHLFMALPLAEHGWDSRRLTIEKTAQKPCVFYLSGYQHWIMRKNEGK